MELSEDQVGDDFVKERKSSFIAHINGGRDGKSLTNNSSSNSEVQTSDSRTNGDRRSSSIETKDGDDHNALGARPAVTSKKKDVVSPFEISVDTSNSQKSKIDTGSQIKYNISKVSTTFFK